MPTPLPASQMKQAEQARNNVATGKKKPEVQHSKSAILTPPTTIYFTKTKMLTQDDKALSTWSYTVSAKELLLLQKIVMAEAEGEPYEGKSGSCQRCLKPAAVSPISRYDSGSDLSKSAI